MDLGLRNAVDRSDRPARSKTDSWYVAAVSVAVARASARRALTGTDTERARFESVARVRVTSMWALVWLFTDILVL